MYLTMASELKKEVTIDTAELFCFNQCQPSVFRIFSVLDFLIIITWKLTEANSQSFWTLLSCFVFSFMSSF